MKKIKQITISLVVLLVTLSICHADVLTTIGPVGSSLTTDEFGVVTSFVVGTILPNTPRENLEYATSFMGLQGGNPLEVANVTPGLSIWIPNNSDPGGDNNGYFLPNRFEDWNFTPPSDNAWHTVLEYNDGNDVHLMGGIGYKLEDPDPIMGSPYVRWDIALQFTNIGDENLVAKNYRYLRPDPVCNNTIYSNHYYNYHDYDRIDGTSDDWAWALHSDNYPFYMGVGYPLAHYRIQSFTDVNGSLWDALTTAVGNYDIVNKTDAVYNHQSEIGFQYPSVTLEPGQAILYWNYTKPFKIENNDANFPSDIDYTSTFLDIADEGEDITFPDTDISINYNDIEIIDFNDSCQVMVVEFTGGLIASAVPNLIQISHVRHWEIFYDTRHASTNADLTFTYDPAFDNIPDDNSIRLLYRTDYDQAWTIWGNTSFDLVDNTITAENMDLDNTQWALASQVALIPQNVVIQVIDNDVIISWEPGQLRTSYNVYRSTDPNVGFEEIYTTSDTTYTDTGAATTETKYFYYITAE